MRVLALFAKHPQPGQVKTRLAAESSPEWAAQVAAAFLHDLVDRLSVLDFHRVLVFTPPESGPYFQTLTRGRFTVTPQADGDLGSRLSAFLTEEFGAGADQVIVLGTDSPTVPLEYVDRASHELTGGSNVVLGPAMDGGYYLLGCTRRLPPIFEDIAWGTSRVLAQTIARLADPSWRLALLPPWYDVDTLDDWRMLQGHLAALRRAGIDPGVPRTEQVPPPS